FLASPRAEMHFIYRHRAVERLRLLAPRHPVRVSPLVSEIGDDRGVGRAQFAGEGAGIAFFQPQAAILRAQRIAVDRAFGQAGNEDFPDATQAMTAHAVNAGIPVVERADDADLIGVGSPYGKADAAHAV